MNLFFKLFLLSIFAIKGFSQIPSGYYNAATGTGYTLKTQLYNIIKNHNDQGYSALWDLYTTSAFRDHWYENDNSLLDLYSEKPSGTDAYEYTSTNDQCGNYSGEGDCYNREHILPQSVFNEASPMRNDPHFVLPSDGYVNGKRSNYPFGVVSSPTWTSTNGSKLGANANSGYSAGYSGTVFEPIDEFKGDVARALFYFATRYENLITNWDYAMFNGTSNQVFTNTFKNILLNWHALDPVSAYEIGKNDEIYYHYQGNRNPYIDHPEWVNSIWGSTANINEIQNLSITIYPNPSSGIINIQSFEPESSLIVYDITGKKVKEESINANQIDVNELDNGFYILKILDSKTIQTAIFLIDKQ